MGQSRSQSQALDGVEEDVGDFQNVVDMIFLIFKKCLRTSRVGQERGVESLGLERLDICR